MGASYYLFAFFVFVLVIIAMLVAKRLFADVKNQHQLLDEKEKKLLELYSTIDEVMEEFYDIVSDSKEDIDSALRRLNNESGRRTSNPPKVVYSQDKLPAERTAPSIIDYVVDEGSSPSKESLPGSFVRAMQSAQEEIPEPDMPSSPKNDKILSMHKKGKTNPEIAKELGITQTEVAMVIGLSS